MAYSLEDIIEGFAVEENLAIDYSEATHSQIIALENILNERTIARPHGGQTYSEHMIEYGRNYPFLTSKDHVVSSYKRHVTNCRDVILPIREVLEIATNGDIEQYSDSDFDSVF